MYSYLCCCILKYDNKHQTVHRLATGCGLKEDQGGGSACQTKSLQDCLVLLREMGSWDVLLCQNSPFPVSCCHPRLLIRVSCPPDMCFLCLDRRVCALTWQLNHIHSPGLPGCPGNACSGTQTFVAYLELCHSLKPQIFCVLELVLHLKVCCLKQKLRSDPKTPVPHRLQGWERSSFLTHLPRWCFCTGFFCNIYNSHHW